MNHSEPDISLRCTAAIVKIAGRCNINCTYCYMYNMGDGSYLSQPKKMSEATVQRLAERVKEHCQTHNLQRFEFILHGGEPMLAGVEFVRHFVSIVRSVLPPGITPGFSMQTNGTLLNEEWCQLIGELNIQTGISMDGTREVHDMYRLDFKGNGTYDAV
jgi:uncharacterized protein